MKMTMVFSMIRNWFELIHVQALADGLVQKFPFRHGGSGLPGLGERVSPDSRVFDGAAFVVVHGAGRDESPHGFRTGKVEFNQIFRQGVAAGPGALVDRQRHLVRAVELAVVGDDPDGHGVARHQGARGLTRPVAEFGDGPLGAKLDPPPIAFTDRDRARSRSVLALYQVISQGVTGTSMPSFATLSEEDRWALAFFAGTLSHDDAMRARGEESWGRDATAKAVFPDLAAAATLTEAALSERMPPDTARDLTAYVRSHPEVTITANGKARQKLVEYVLNHHPEATERLRCVSRIGWHDLRYVLPTSVHGQQDGEGVIYQGADSGDFASAGTLEDWRQHIAAMAAGNSRIVFAISVAFAGVLADMAGESGGGFHYVGTTSKGKTSTLLDPAASVWGSPDRFAKKWRTTQNGLEALCLGRNDNLLILDELAQIAAADAGGAAYLIANGQAKARMTKEGGNRPAQTWRVMLLSAGEIDLAQHMAEAGKTARGGQMARLPAIPADAGAGMGTLEALHHHTSGQAFADAMKGSTRSYYGTAGQAFLEKLASPEEQQTIRAEVRAQVAKALGHMGIPDGAAEEVGRVAARFALVAFAGELATRYGVTGWQAGEAFRAARRCFREWLAENNTGQAADDRALFAQVAAFMQAHSSTRFPPHDAAPDVLARYLNRAGFTFTDDDGSLQFWVMPESFKKELCKGFQPRNAARALIKAGWMLAGDIEGNKQRSTRQKRIRALNSTKVNVYILTSAALAGEE